MTGDKRLLALADDLGARLLPVFDSPTGLPYKNVNLKTGKTSNAVSNPAETGTLIIEFGTLSKLTGKPVYYEKAKRACRNVQTQVADRTCRDEHQRRNRAMDKYEQPPLRRDRFILRVSTQMLDPLRRQRLSVYVGGFDK